MPKGYMYVFVYGTLKRGFRNYPCMQLARGEFICNSELKGAKIWDSGRSYPYLSLSDDYGSSTVKGEVFRVPVTGVYKYLDELEGYPIYYLRKKVKVSVFGKLVDAWVYYIEEYRLHSGTKEILGGVWRVH